MSLLILSPPPENVSPRLVNKLQPHPKTSAFILVLQPVCLSLPHKIQLISKNTTKLQRYRLANNPL